MTWGKVRQLGWSLGQRGEMLEEGKWDEVFGTRYEFDVDLELVVS
jgi:hypothetical protein